MTASQLALRVRRPPVTVDLKALVDIRDLSHALVKCADASGSNDKALAADLDIDVPTWTRIKQGEAGVKGDFLERLMDACGNELPLLYLLHARGYDPASLRRYQTDVERELDSERSRRAEAERELDTIKKFMRETRAGV